MNNRFCTLVSVLLFLAVSFCIAEETTESKPNTDEQLEINKIALLSGPDEKIRVKAATIMLNSENPAAMQILLETLSIPDNPAARTAICRAIIDLNGKNAFSKKNVFIEPLINVLIGDNKELAKLAARALLAFDYMQVELPLIAKINDENLSTEARLNAVYAVRIQPDIDAIVLLIELLDNPNKEISSSAQDALSSLGIPAYETDAKMRKQIISDLKRIGKEEFIRIWKMRKDYEQKLEQLRQERDEWQNKSLALLEELYTRTGTDETSKAEFLTRYLNSNEKQERLWAVNKISQWWKGTDTKTKVLSDLGPILITLIQDADKDIRLNVAKLLSFMGELNSSQMLLQQMQIETNEEVKLQQFIALGQACRYAFSPQSPFQLENEVRINTLNKAVDYLENGNNLQAQKGAEVIRNNLEHNGLSDEQVEKYLQALAKRYNTNSIDDDTLKSELLNSMAMLCGRGVYKQRALEIFERIFIASLTDDKDVIRESAVNGLINISKTQALSKLRESFPNDSNPNIRKKLITLAEEVGTEKDLPWLFEKININSEVTSVWKTILKIFERSDAELMAKWTKNIESQQIDPVKKISFYEILEQKARSAENKQLENNTRLKLAELYQEINEFTQASSYLPELIKNDLNKEKKDMLTAELLKLYLNNGQIEPALSLISNQIMEKDFGADGPVGKVLLEFMKTDSPNLKSLTEGLAKLETKQADKRPKWKKLQSTLTQKEDKPTEPREKTEEPRQG